MAKKLYEESKIAAIAEKIREKTGTDETYTTAEMPSGVEAVYEAGAASGGGAKVVEEKDVNFYDYDGTLLYSYTVAEAQALTELPPAPTPKRDFLVFQEWNWTLEQIKEINLPVNVGATYTTSDGGIYAVVNISDPDLMTITLNFVIDGYSGLLCTLDWGDGETEGIYYSNGNAFSPTHSYKSLGEYTIILRSNYRYSIGRGNELPFVDKSNKYVLKEIYLTNAYIQHSGFKYQATLECINISKEYPNITYSTFTGCNALKALIFPSTCKTIAASGAEEVSSLGVVSFPYNMEKIDYNSAGNSCIRQATIPPKVTDVGFGLVRSLKRVYFAEGCKRLANQFADGTYALCKIDLPSTLTTMDVAALRNAKNLRTITIPVNVSTIQAQVLSGCTSLQRISFLPTTPPTVANANAFSGIPTTCVVEVPSASLAAYQAATNYASISAQMVGV